MDSFDARIDDNPTILQSKELHNYILKTSVYPREPAALKEIREATASHSHAFYATDPDVGQLIAMMLKLVNAKKTIEIGVFTGYSLLLTALNIPEDGKIIAVDPNREAYEIGAPIIEKAGVIKKIKFIESPGLPILDKLLEDKSNEGSFDFAFIDADKYNYWNYHQRIMKLVRVGGLLMYDNTLFGGAMIGPETQMVDVKRPHLHGIIEFNKAIATDDRVELCHIPSGDGVTICKRIR
ncbi:hypothetical protein Nepgr_015550 [Nepenthes gracilis]|uniref:Caffeoyl-CoA O-methyltransferase n=1 Tax=Nepenthes gracilis TaxID=150966 RepID=A0AAD3XR76_NEPGR|nr:hypothetical protein Nepgr_015550 [Nepenthes gracilis]